MFYESFSIVPSKSLGVGNNVITKKYRLFNQIRKQITDNIRINL